MNGEKSGLLKNMIECCNTGFYYLLYSFYKDKITIPFTFLYKVSVFSALLLGK